MQHLNSTRVLHIAGFITVCEAFLEMEPHTDFFRRLFSPRALTVGDPAEIAPVGGFALHRKPGVGDSYPAYLPCDSNRGWHGEWFYIRNPMVMLFPVFTGGRPKKQDSWSWGCARKEKKKVEIIEEELWKLVRHGLDGVSVFHTLYRRRVAPLAERARPMWRYSGVSNPDRVSSEELPDDEV